MAFLNFGNRAFVFEFRNIKRAGNHAITASHAFAFAPDDGALLFFQHGLYQAGRSARRLIAVHALSFDKNRALFRLITIDHRPSLGAGASG